MAVTMLLLVQMQKTYDVGRAPLLRAELRRQVRGQRLQVLARLALARADALLFAQLGAAVEARLGRVVQAQAHVRDADVAVVLRGARLEAQHALEPGKVKKQCKRAQQQKMSESGHRGV